MFIGFMNPLYEFICFSRVTMRKPRNMKIRSYKQQRVSMQASQINSSKHSKLSIATKNITIISLH
ncbi:hypothetical protein Hanom_Chr16g01481081 [Helianthus anomalus]